MRAWWLLLLVLPGCDRLALAESAVSPVVAQGLFLGMDLPEGLDFEGTDVLEYTAACTAFVAELSDPTDVEQAPVEGARVGFESAANGRIDLVDQGDGKYQVTAADGLVYEPGDTAELVVGVGGEVARLTVRPPEAPEVDVPDTWEAQAPVTLGLTEGGYQNMVVAVYDLDRSRMTFDNLPDDVDATYAFTHPDEPVDRVTIPGEAWLRGGTYVVGVAGMQMADPEAYEGVNTTLSAFMAGRFALHLVVIEE